jgi:hypothetical protein
MKVFMTVFMKLALHAEAMYSPATRQLLTERRFPGSYGQGGNHAKVRACHLLGHSATPDRRVAAEHRVGEHDGRWVDARCEQATVTLSQSTIEPLWLTNNRRPLNPETMYRVRTGDRQPVRRFLVRVEPLLDHLDRYL